ncbi:beta-hexosaminidase [Ventosimonas gracilis]|uniref:Beta-hexosaminidase n=1 Tax=Ventosimonas gracilis TaxID=1680762 RepID=A0A139SK18_9GAMM|nr:beta-N-acetylhexosaminidase [Ventosimonas gracilis]KXU34840.1 beta-hexosaminidase [Ventosimonas gracilis]
MTHQPQAALMLDIESTTLSTEDRHILRQREVCGVILFARNIEHPEQVKELCAAIRTVRPDLLLAVDQEGGRVQRLREGFVRLPPMRSLLECGANSELLAQQCGFLMASEVLAVGLDFSFAPVLDLDYGASEVIGDRAFATSPGEVTKLAAAFIQGMNEAGMAACGKHFPGHGYVRADSHLALPVDTRSLEQIRQSCLQPFIQLAPSLAAVMPAHVVYPQVDEQPAGFSRRWLQDILRGELNFNGLIFSDDLTMQGAACVGDLRARTEASLAAGSDVALVCNDRASAEQALICLQQRKAAPPTQRLAAMRGRRLAADVAAQKHKACAALREAGLIA